VVLLNGAGARLGFWNKVEPALAAHTAVVAYDRTLPAGYKAAPVPLGAATVTQLRGLLGALGIEPPWLLVGHSMGGLYANLFARLHPTEVAGVVMVDATHPAQERRFAAQPSFSTTALRRVIAVYDRLFGPGVLTEVVATQAIGDEVLAAPAFPEIPLAVITAGEVPPAWMIPPHLWQVHLANQAELAALSPQGVQLIAAGSDHLVPQRQPQIIIDAVLAMLDTLRGYS
jgi:pimeloyl-ACP methyl ester carboxylesterase